MSHANFVRPTAVKYRDVITGSFVAWIQLLMMFSPLAFATAAILAAFFLLLVLLSLPGEAVPTTG